MNDGELKKIIARGFTYLAATLLAVVLTKSFELEALHVIAVILFMASAVGFSLSLGIVVWRNYVKVQTVKYSLASNPAELVAFAAVGVILAMVWLLSTII